MIGVLLMKNRDIPWKPRNIPRNIPRYCTETVVGRVSISLTTFCHHPCCLLAYSSPMKSVMIPTELGTATSHPKTD